MKKLFLALIAISSCVFASNQYLPHDCHQAVSTAVNGAIVVFEDGSQWTIHPEDRNTVLHWHTQDVLTFSLNNAFFPASRFYITNPRTGEYVRADIKLGPSYDSQYRKRVVGIDHYYGEICLEDGFGYQTWWTVDSSDRHQIDNWTVNHTVIIGCNDGWYAGFFSSYDSILYCIDHDVTVRAREH